MSISGNIIPSNLTPKKKNDNIIIAGCPCYILHNAFSKAGDAFNKTTGFDMSDHCFDLYYWFNKSSKRKCTLKECYKFCDLEYDEVIKYFPPVGSF